MIAFMLKTILQIDFKIGAIQFEIGGRNGTNKSSNQRPKHPREQ